MSRHSFCVHFKQSHTSPPDHSYHHLPGLDKHAALALAHVQNTFCRPQMHLALLLLVFLRA